jgi:hypothetical protein
MIFLAYVFNLGIYLPDLKRIAKPILMQNKWKLESVWYLGWNFMDEIKTNVTTFVLKERIRWNYNTLEIPRKRYIFRALVRDTQQIRNSM